MEQASSQRCSISVFFDFPGALKTSFGRPLINWGREKRDLLPRNAVARANMQPRSKALLLMEPRLSLDG